MILICIIFWYHWAEQHVHTDDASRGITHRGAENIWRKPMSRQHAPAPNLVLTRCTVGKVSRHSADYKYSFKDFLKDSMDEVVRLFKGNEFQFFAPSILRVLIILSSSVWHSKHVSVSWSQVSIMYINRFRKHVRNILWCFIVDRFIHHYTRVVFYSFMEW